MRALLVRLGILWPPRSRPLAGRCEVCDKIAELKLTPYRDSCRWVCRGCYLALNDDGAGP